MMLGTVNLPDHRNYEKENTVAVRLMSICQMGIRIMFSVKSPWPFHGPTLCQW